MNSPRASSPASEALESRHDSDEIPEPGDNEHEPTPPVSRIEDVRTSQAFVQCLKEARLEDSGLEEEDIEAPPQPIRYSTRSTGRSIPPIVNRCVLGVHKRI